MAMMKRADVPALQLEGAAVPPLKCLWKPHMCLPHGKNWRPIAKDRAKEVQAETSPFYCSVLNNYTQPWKYFFKGKQTVVSDAGRLSEVPMTIWHYEHCSGTHGLVLRETAQITLNLAVTPLSPCKSRIVATTLAGNAVYERDFDIPRLDLTATAVKADLEWFLINKNNHTEPSKLFLVHNQKKVQGVYKLARYNAGMSNAPPSAKGVKKASFLHNACVTNVQVAVTTASFSKSVRGDDRALLLARAKVWVWAPYRRARHACSHAACEAHLKKDEK